MKLAFLISTGKDARHLTSLINSLPEDATYYVLVDSKRSLLHFKRSLFRENVNFISHRVNVVDGSIREVEAQVELLRAALTDGADYMVYLSGQDYPLWSNDRIVKCFNKADGHEFLTGVAMPGQGRAAYPYTDLQPLSGKPWRTFSAKGQMRISLRRLINGLHIHKTLRIHCPEKTYTLYKGSSSWAITPDLAELVVKMWDENKRFVNYFRTSYRPVETFVPTVAFNSDLASRCDLVKGRYPGTDALNQLTYIDGKTAKILTEVDFAELKVVDKMFCRKVVSKYSDGLVSMIDAVRRVK